jgi:hypothetical protein
MMVNGGSGVNPEPTVKVWMGEGSVEDVNPITVGLVPFFTIVKRVKFNFLH